MSADRTIVRKSNCIAVHEEGCVIGTFAGPNCEKHAAQFAALSPSVPLTVPIPHEEDVEGHLLYEVRCDAARWNTLPAFLEKYQIDYVGLKQDIDAVLAGNCCEPDLCETQSECDSLGCRIERASLVGLGQSDGIAADIDKGIPVAAAGAPEEAPSVVNVGGDGQKHDFKAAASALPHGGDSSATTEENHE